MTLQALNAHHALTKPAREIYVGNLNPSFSQSLTIKQFFADLYNALPEYRTKYAALAAYGPVRDVKLTGEAVSYCFLDFWTEELASTAILFDKVDFYGRKLKIGRATCYDLSSVSFPPPLDVAELRSRGILPPETPLDAEARRARQVYVGNLPGGGRISSQQLRDLFEPACRKLPEFDAEISSAVLDVEVHDEARFAFVELQSEALATAALGIFNNTEILGRRIFVGRAQPGLSGSSGQRNALNTSSQPALH